ncbi:MAG: glucoamylase family protein [Pseudomonas sp.]|nr:glucoamylase family protein [Pseudomonas sp.]
MNGAPLEDSPGSLESVAAVLGERHRLASERSRDLPVWVHIDALPAWLLRVQTLCLEPAPELTKAAEWLLDNSYQVQRAAVQIAEDLPRNFYQRLPGLSNPGETGIPRIFALAQGYLHASRLQLSMPSAVQFISAYQAKAPLSIAELWAFPIMLRLACVEILVSAFSRLLPELPAPFAPTPHSIELGAFEDTECVARALANLGIIAAIPWKDFFERSSLVEMVLRNDPAGIYAQMDFDTRDRYRKALEELAEGAQRDECEVAQRVLAQAQSGNPAEASGHVGYWLIGPGRARCEQALDYRPTFTAAWRRWLFRHAGPAYAGALGLAAGAALLLPGWYLALVGADRLLWWSGIALALLPSSVLSITLVHWLITLNLPVRVLPKLDFSAGIRPDCRTAVVVPVLLRDIQEAQLLCEQMEMHYLANPDPQLQFVLLSDHVDAPTQQLADDAALEQHLQQGIARLNQRHGHAGQGPFYLLHRPRLFNPGEGCWMGWERKRGKLEQFNRYLLGSDEGAFSLTQGDAAALRGSRFVVTVDADTGLPAGTVARLVGTLAHPLNSAEFDPDSGRVCRGYTVLQPRVEIAPERGNRSLFARLYTGDTAIDIYTRAVSDVYQDLFGSGIFVGKGIYEVAPFQRSLEGRIPENSLVSHDLFEGVHGRAGLVSDIVLYEGFPSSYLDYTRRQHRWVRGDWQLLPWLRRRVPGSDGQRRDNRLQALDRWKLLDNLRRSLVPLALVALVTAGWLFLPGSPWVWTLLAIAVPSAYLFTELVTGLAHGRRRGAVRSTLRRLQDHAGRWLLMVTFLLNDAAIALDAQLRTLWRLAESRRHLLEWTTAAHQAQILVARGSRGYAWQQMWVSPVFALLLAELLWLFQPGALMPAAPLLLLWLLAPEVALAIGKPRYQVQAELDHHQRAFLRRLARRTWLYFETFVGPDDNWLPPDNYQEEPYTEIAHRTSPTNIGMLLLSTLTAADLGYISCSDMTTRIRRCLDTLERLERYRGHWLNWYDTRLLRPLEPRYVSTVDSGNLALCLLTLQQGCLEIAAGAALRDELWYGLEDTLALLCEALTVVEDDEVRACLTLFSETCSHGGWDSGVFVTLQQQEAALRMAIGQAMPRQRELSVQQLKEIHSWLERVHHHLLTITRERERLLPWWPLLESAPAASAVLAQQIAAGLPASLNMLDSANACAQAQAELASVVGSDAASSAWQAELLAALASGCLAQQQLRQSLLEDAARAASMALQMDFRPLYDEQSRLFHIGYNLSAERLDSHHYDLLASEARLASYFAIMKGDVPLEHWFFLGRPLAQMAGGLALLSWNGSMFEYLMPPLLLPSHPGALLGHSERAAVIVQRQFAQAQDVPWGVSESAFASRDVEHRYRYRAFGVPALGLRREVARDLVIAPYASVLALAVNPGAAVANLQELQQLGLIGSYGFFEAADFTSERVASGRRFTTVRAYMAHHQGMILAALDNALCAEVLVRRLCQEPRVRVMELLLHERIPQELPAQSRLSEPPRALASSTKGTPPPYAWVPKGAELFPQVHVLGNGRLSSWISSAGGGGLSWHQHALTRWQGDATRDHQGLWIYLRDEQSGAVWSATRQPTGVLCEHEQVVFHPHMAEFRRHDQGIGLRLEVTIAAADDLEIRRLTLTNESDRVRHLQLTSYAEVVLAPPLDDERHPAFSKLFVGSEYLPQLQGLLFTRRPRHPEEKPPLLLHRVVINERQIAGLAWESDREGFVGRHGDERHPQGVVNGLSGTTGWTLDPVLALQVGLVLEPGAQQQLAFLTLAGGSRQSLLELAERYATLSALDWAFADAASEASREARQLGLEPDWLVELQMLASLLLHPHPSLRCAPGTRQSNRLGQPRLWGMGISGDRSILLLRIAHGQEAGLLRLLIRGQRLWRRHGLHVDLVLLRMGSSGYAEPLREQLHGLLQDSGINDELPLRSGGIHLLFADQLHIDDLRVLESCAAVLLDESAGSIAQQLAAVMLPQPVLPLFSATGAPFQAVDRPLLRPDDLLFDNGLGGFSADGREYLIHLQAGQRTPAPWCNVLANDGFGCLVSEAGLGCSWALNSGENRLTPWFNDPLADLAGEALYLRDEEDARIWTTTPLPAGEHSACQIRHGAGYSQWVRHSHGLEQALLVFVPVHEPVKVIRLRLHNPGAGTRRITATYYAEWLLGALRSRARAHVVCEYDRDNHVLLARNPWNPDFSEGVAFLSANLPPHSLTANRQDFFGREGHPASPAGLLRWALGGRIEAGDDPCGAFQVHLDIPAGETAEVVFLLGQGADREQALALTRAWQTAEQVERGYVQLQQHWDRQLTAVQVQTPDPALNLMVNRWLLYQTLASRILARAGFYQASGAIGYRDQLQDVLALLHSDPQRARTHILNCAAHQFEEGDVLHWWHPPMDRGVRTRCSDDLLWLPYVTSRYVEATGDLSILNEPLAFLQAPVLAANEEDRYARFTLGGPTYSLFEHCARALQHGVSHGPHGLPLMGAGDWNDGMNRLGRQGRGESVWLGWFAVATMRGFAGLARRQGQLDQALHWHRCAEQLHRQIEALAWDGNWYLRALDDNGKALGSHADGECRIDSISQSWSVLADGHGNARSGQALSSVLEQLVSAPERLIRLLWPPFTSGVRDPGYIQAYPPGVRENGGQYSHAAAWLGMAFAEFGDAEAAWRVFELLNPVLQAQNPQQLARYRVEPYVLAADIASVEPHSGRGGWTWYSGSAAWTWRLAVESILGLRLRDGQLLLKPCLPKAWAGFSATVRGPAGTLQIEVRRAEPLAPAAAWLSRNGEPLQQQPIAFPCDGSTQVIKLCLPACAGDN